VSTGRWGVIPLKLEGQKNEEINKKIWFFSNKTGEEPNNIKNLVQV